MFPKLLLLALASASVVLAAPAPPTPSDTQILQYALTLEYLENAFYTGALDKYDAKAFTDAGFAPWVRARFEQIMDHEKTHVKFLQTALGSAAPQACNYTFPYNDPESFVQLAMGIEGVGAAAYLGASKYISDKDTLTAAASILAVEQRQVGWMSSAVLKEQPWDGPFETPLGLSAVYSLASPFITSCPSSNPALPVITLPAFKLPAASPWPGATISLTFDNPNNASPTFVAWFSGLDVVFTTIDGNKNTVVPTGLQGTVYAGVVSSDTMPLADSDMVTGLTIVQFPFDSMAAEVDNA
ncbi:hypothetical protein POSPLADRAFT_1060911 [Postia placenta MAD-698-R-SB12]|uniref:Ferritin-like domain-containing protein n=1 Tax=Postia placenta MAD-698-R-SB12 TaxID=670580 RepID=A0A1X6MPS9_9APHY|nr:hypothetical protein POSPLADRAFT_1060911 [Postia placenta MAD-698-R-SB12]OSX58427.1 hypothetical protein POSPLADRAFT_1060911 [Postia placenta MAD-698-R-SB12]